MATERGRKALLNAASLRSDIVDRFGRLDNDEERALWMLMEHPGLFREGEELRFFDYYSESRRGRHFRTLPDIEVSREPADIAGFMAEVCRFHRGLDGSGISCEVEFAERHQDGSIQVAIYVQGLPNNGMEFVDGKHVRRVSNPSLEEAIVYDQRSGTTSTVAKGGKEVHAMLCEAFARRLLKIDPKFDVVRKRSFRLDTLKSPTALAPDPALGVKAVRVRRLKFVDRIRGFSSSRRQPECRACQSTTLATTGSPSAPACITSSQWCTQ
jgi:hypothetical protein